MKFVKLLVFCLLVLLPFAVGQGEISTNLYAQKEYNENKKIASLTYVDEFGTPTVAEDLGYATIRYNYRYNRQVGYTYYDLEGNKVNSTGGWAECRITHSSRGYVIERGYYDADGNLVIGPEGYARQTNDYELKYLLKTTNYGPDNKLLRSDKLFAVGVHRPVEQNWLNADGEVVPGPDGYAIVRYTYQDNHYLLSKTYYDETDAPYFYNKAGYARVEYEIKNGKTVKESYFDADLQLNPGPEGYAYVQYAYEAGQTSPTLIQYFSVEGTPYLTDKGYAAIERSYGKMGWLASESYLGTDGERVRSTDGWSKVNYFYNSKKKPTEITYYNENNERMIVEELGYFKVVNTYLKGTYLEMQEYFDVNGEPVNCAEGYQKIVYDLDSKGRVLEQIYADAEGVYAAGKNGYARVTYENDANGKHIVSRYYDIYGEPYVDANGANELHQEWDADGREIVAAYYLDGQPILSPKGYHLVRTEYNANGKVTAKGYYDLNDDLVMTTDGYAFFMNEYDAAGTVCAVRYYDRAGSLVTLPGKAYAYSLRQTSSDGTVVTTTTYDEKNNPVNDTAGFAVKQQIKNAEGRVIRESWFDVDGKAVPNGNTYVAVLKEYDAAGNVIRETRPCALRGLTRTAIPRRMGMPT